MRIGAIFGRLLVAGAVATAVFALAAASGILPTAVTQSQRTERRDHHRSDRPELGEIAELLRREGFSKPSSLEREHGKIEVEATGPDGRRYEILIDPKTGRILEKEEED